MWLGLITSNGLGNDQNPKKLLGPFKTKREASEAVVDKVRFAGERGFVLEGEEIVSGMMPCPECGGHGKTMITECEANEVHIKGYLPCEVCHSTGKVPRLKPCPECGGDCINKSAYRKKKR